MFNTLLNLQSEKVRAGEKGLLSQCLMYEIVVLAEADGPETGHNRF